MSCYTETRSDLVEFQPLIKHNLPLAICDRSLAYHIGVHNKTLWFLTLKKDALYKTFYIKKRGKNKSKRMIQNPDTRLKRTQSVFLTRFLNKIPIPDHIGAYVLGRSCIDTARKHVGSAIIISMDIKDFFPSVKRYMIRRYFLELGYNHRVASLMTALVTYQNFLPQGAPTSGMIANLVADQRFDRAIIHTLSQFEGWRYTRYSDDIAISHPEKQPRERIQQIINIVRVRLRSAGFKLNEQKTRTVPYWRQQRILGVVVNEKLNLSRVEYMRLKAMVHNYLVHGFSTQLGNFNQANEEALIAHIHGKLSWLKQIDPQKAEHLMYELDIATKIHNGTFNSEA